MNAQPTFLFLTYFLTQWIMAILSKWCKPDSFKSHKFLKLKLQILLNVNVSLNQTLLTFLLYVRQTWMTQLILALSLWGVYLPLTWKDSTTHAWSCSFMKEGLPFAWDLLLENSADSYSCFWVALPYSVITFFVFVHSFWFCFI